jgi:maltooligosyltrehalose trehalohydrolase
MTVAHSDASQRKLAVGAECSIASTGVHFRVWAPEKRHVYVVLESASAAIVSEHEMQRESKEYFSCCVADASKGALYRFRFDDDLERFPDPASRFQPFGPHGPSQVVTPDDFSWTDEAWTGVTLADQVLYELHVGTFTTAGTWQAAARQLTRLRELGITAVEIMPIAEFPGRFGWGYDGVDLFAPSHLYGTPDDFRAFVDAAHNIGVGVLLDVVYNHVGPEGNVLARFAHRYFSRRHTTEWGEALNFDDDAKPVREFVMANAAYWIREYHVDGLRLDATQQIFDDSSTHILEEIAAEARRAAGKRSVLVIAENEPQDCQLIRPAAEGGFGLDALWNDDFHHAAVVALTGRREAYYSDFGGSPQELLSLAKWGFLFQGQRSSWQRKRRGSPAFGRSHAQFITFLQNHDQVANSPWGHGERLHQLSSPGAYRAITAYWLLLPGTPMFFQGQEFGASTPFCYFADHPPPLADLVRRGRAEFMRQFRSLVATPLFARLPSPSHEATFEASQLNDADVARGSSAVALHRDLLALRRSDFSSASAQPIFVDGSVLGPAAFAIRFFVKDPREHLTDAADRLLLVNLGVDLRIDPAPEPLLAPLQDCEWTLRWSSEDPSYGGIGTAAVETDRGWLIPGSSAVVLRPCPIQSH